MKRAMKFKETDYEECTSDFGENTKRKVPISYRKLVVPTRMRSIYWKYFGFPASDDGTIITRDRIICALCKSQMIYNRNTTNLRMHLNSRHKNIMKKLGIIDDTHTSPNNNAVKKTRNKSTFNKTYEECMEFSGVDVMNVSKRKGNESSNNLQVVMSEEINDSDISNIAIIFPNNEEMNQYETPKPEEIVDSSKISDAIANFLISDLISPDIVDGKGFHHLLSVLTSETVVVPNEKKLIYDIIPTIYNTCKEQIFNNTLSNCITNISLSIEEWICGQNLKCLTIYMHYLQNGEPLLFTKCLTTIYCTGSESVKYWARTLDKIFEEWSINSSAITAVLTSFSIIELEEALKLKKIVTLPCFLYLLQDLCSKHCFNNPQIVKILRNCRHMIQSISEVKPDILQIDASTDEDENDLYFLTYDQPDLWLTSYYMIKNLLLRKDAILGNMGFDSGEYLSINDWKIINDVVNLLEPLKTIVITLFEEKSPLISLLKPLIWKINSSKFEISSSDTPLIKELKTSIKNVLNEAYTEENSDNLTQIATTLDPRFKAFVQQDDNFNSNSENNLTNLLTNLVETEGSLSPQSCSSQTPKRKSSGINALFGNFYVNKPSLKTEDKIKTEVTYYLTENSALLEECPLEWWQHMNSKCPNLIRLAHKYHCVPAIVLNSIRSTREYIKFYKKRAALKETVADPILFLHLNKHTL